MGTEYVHAKTELQAVKSQLETSRLSPADNALRMSLLGQQYVADWKYLLAAAGRMYSWSIPEHATGGGAITQATGNAAVDLDQPEGVLAMDLGYSIIPVEIQFGIQNDADAYDDQVEIYLFTDRTQATAAGATATVANPKNCLDDGPAFPGRAFNIVTADVPDPVHSDVLYYNVWELTQVAAETAGSGIPNFSGGHKWDVPRINHGPCQFILALAGTVAPTFVFNMTLGVVPSSWFPTS